MVERSNFESSSRATRKKQNERKEKKRRYREVGRAFPRYCNCSEFCRRGVPRGPFLFLRSSFQRGLLLLLGSRLFRETRVDKNVIALSSPRRFTSINLPVTLSRDRDRCQVTSFPNIHRSDLFTPPRKSPFLASPSPRPALFLLLSASRRLSFSNLSSPPSPSCVFRSRNWRPSGRKDARRGERERRDDGAMEKASWPARIHSYAAASLLAFRHCVRSHTRMCAPPPFDSCILATSDRRGRRKRAVNGDEPAATGERWGYARGTSLSTDE